MVYLILRYYLLTLHHKWHVFLEGIRFGVPFGQILIHDWDKFLPSIAYPYALRWIAKDRSVEASLLYVDALTRHIHRNKHHWEYWNPDLYIVNEIPPKYLMEMIADWFAASRVHGNVSVYTWYRENRDKIILAPRTRHKVDFYMMWSSHCRPVVENAP